MQWQETPPHARWLLNAHTNRYDSPLYAAPNF